MISDQRSHACGHRDLTVASHPQVLSPVCRNCGRTWADPASSPEPSMHPIRKMTMNKKTQQERKLDATMKGRSHMKNPPHPGGLIMSEVISSLNLSMAKAARLLKVQQTELSNLLHGKISLTPEMALRIEKVFGPDMRHLLRMQFAYDLANDGPV